MRMVLAFLLLDLTVKNRGDNGWALKHAERFIKEHGNRYINDLVSWKLMTLYCAPNIGAGNRERIGKIYAETQAKARGVGSSKVMHAGSAKSDIMRKLRDRREEILKKDD